MKNLFTFIAQRRLVPLFVIVLLNLVILVIFGSISVYREMMRPADEFVQVVIPPAPPKPVPAAPPAQPPPQAQSDEVIDPVNAVVPPPMALDIATTTSPAKFELHAPSSLGHSTLNIMSLPSSGGAAANQAGVSDSSANPDSSSTATTFSPFGGNAMEGSPMLTGYMFDTKQTREKKPTGMTLGNFYNVLRNFVANRFNETLLSGYYRSQSPLGVGAICIPSMKSVEAPKAFHVDKEMEASLWTVHYHGVVSAPETGDYTFAGMADNVLIVAIDHRLVLGAGMTDVMKDPSIRIKIDTADGKDYELNKGKTFHAEAGQPMQMDVVIGDDGGATMFKLYLMTEGKTYATNRGYPVLPFFRLSSALHNGLLAQAPVKCPAWDGIVAAQQ